MAEENQDGQEKTEEATPKRQQEARDEGQIARSRELNTMLMLMAAASALIFMGEQLISDLSAVMTQMFSPERELIFDLYALPRMVMSSIEQMVWILAPFCLVMLVVALLAPLSLGGWSFSTKVLEFKFERMDPVKGLQRVFALRGLVELLKALAKFSLIAGVGVLYLKNNLPTLLTLGDLPLEHALITSVELMSTAFLVVSAGTIGIALVDVPFQVWDHSQKLKMTRNQIREEMKQTEGRPEVKQRIRSLQQEVAMRRMMEDVPKADVIVTNPTHYAVALQYDADRMGAPRVLAKGADEVAQRIRELARYNNIRVLSTPPLARALYFSTKVNQEIPEGLYVAVAKVLAYVFQTRQKNGAVRPEAEAVLADLPIPEQYRRDPES